MSSIKLDLSDVAKRIVSLSSSYASDKEFLKQCDISNLSFLTDVKKGRANSPGADKLQKIVRGTGCSGTWLLTGRGKMFYEEKEGEGRAATDDTDYGLISQAFELLNRIERQLAAEEDVQLPEGIELQVSQLLTRILERRQKDRKG